MLPRQTKRSLVGWSDIGLGFNQVVRFLPAAVESDWMNRNFRLMFSAVSLVALFALAPSSASALTIDQIGNGGFTNADPVTVSYGDPGGLSGANCILDAGVSVLCTNSGVELGGLAEGQHTLVVNAVVLTQGPCIAWIPPENVVCVGWSQIGTPVQASATFTVDRTAPTLSLTGGPAEGSTSTLTSAAFTIDGGDGTVACTLDGAPVTCGVSADLTALTIGAHQFVVSSTDQAGNVSTATRNFVVMAPAGGAPPAPTPAAAAGRILSAPKSVKVRAKIRLKIACPDGCTITVEYKGAGKKRLQQTLVLTAGATTATFKPTRSISRKLATALKKHKRVSAVFTLAGGASKSTRIKA